MDQQYFCYVPNMLDDLSRILCNAIFSQVENKNLNINC